MHLVELAQEELTSLANIAVAWTDVAGLIVAGDTKEVALLTVVYLLFQMQDG